MDYKRPVFFELVKRLEEPRRFMQILAGPRQTGKTTLALQAIESSKIKSHFASADEPAIKDRTWIEQQWDVARLMARNGKTLLVLDEVQKVSGWSEIVKFLWDSDTRNKVQLQVLLLGSSPLLMQKGLSESLTGRFETLRVTHWPYYEMKKAFNIGVNEFIYFGGYPGSVALMKDQARWKRYIADSIIETSISRDVLLMTRVDKPALLRRLFDLGCVYSGQVLSYQKMTGQLQDAGNTTTLAHYLDLLSGAGLITGLQKYSERDQKEKSSSPKLLVMNTAIMSAMSNYDFDEAMNNPEYWGRLVESAVGAHLLTGVSEKTCKLNYWSGANKEVDYVFSRKGKVIAIEVKSNRKKTSLPGISAFSNQFNVDKNLLIGGQGLPLEEFFMMQPEELFV
jgi:predicted AAA+ superfamily ATPase